MRLIHLYFLLFTSNSLLSQVPINNNPLLPFDKLIVNGIDIGENGLIQNKNLDSNRIVTYVSYIPAFTFGDDYHAFDQLMDGTYGKLAIKNNDLDDIYSWSPGEIFTSEQIRVLGCYNLDIRPNRITLLVAANNSNTLGFGSLFLGLLEFDTTLQLISKHWFTDPYAGLFRSEANTIRLKNGNYLRYGKLQPGELALAEFDINGVSVNYKPLGLSYGGSLGGGGNICEMPNGEIILNPGLILDSNYNLINSYQLPHDINRKYFGSIVPINDQSFVYGYGSLVQSDTNGFTFINISAQDINGNNSTLFYKENLEIQSNPLFRERPGMRAIEGTDSSNILIAYTASTLSPQLTEIIVRSINTAGSSNWSIKFGGDSGYSVLDFIRTSDARYHLIIFKSFDIAWIDPMGFPFPKTDLMYVSLDTLGNVISISSDSEPDAKHRLMVYPNPARKIIHIEDFGQYSSLKVDLFDITGRLIYNHTSCLKQIDISNMLNGIYFYRITTEDGLFLQAGKLIKTE